MNLNGLAVLEKVHAIEDEEYEEAIPVPVKKEQSGADTAMEDASLAKDLADDKPQENGDISGKAEPQDKKENNAGVNNQDTSIQKEKMEKKTRTKRLDVPVTSETSLGYDQQTLNNHFEQEHQMQAADKLQEETQDRRNALEAYIYAMRDKLYNTLSHYVKEQDKEHFASTLNKLEDWLYEDGEDETKSVYVAKLEEMRKVGDPIERRAVEDQTRPGAIEALQSVINYYSSMAASTDPHLSHIEALDKDKVMRECQAAAEWLAEKQVIQAQMYKYEEPVLLTNDILKKRDVVERVCKPIMTKPRPAPPKPPVQEPQKTAAGKDSAAAGGAQEDAIPMDSENAATQNDGPASEQNKDTAHSHAANPMEE